jgi:hypothetical protein
MTGGAAERRWHVGDYGLLGWAETGVKAVAFAIAYVALARALDGDLATPGGVQIAELVLLGVAELGLLLAIGDRLIQRELIAAVFVLFANTAHLCMLYALCTVPGPGHLLTYFCAFMLAGELVKLLFLRETGFTVRETAPVVVQGLVVAYALIYAVAIVLWQIT